MRENQRKAKNKKLAEDRIAMLWEHYNANGKLTIADVKAITGRQASNVYASFAVHGLEAPPVFDFKSEIRRRQIKLLSDKATALGKNWLSSQEAAQALGIKLKNVFRVDNRLKGNIPEIRYSRARCVTEDQSMSDSDMPRILIGDPCALHYYRKEDGPGQNEITYYIR